MPDPMNPMRNIELPIQLYIEKGVRRSTDEELNWFWDHAPWAIGGSEYDPASSKIINLFKREKIAVNKQAKAMVMVRLVEKVQKMNDMEIISAGKIVSRLNTPKKFITFNEQNLYNPETKDEEITCLRADLLDMASKEPHLLEGVLMRKESKIIKDVHLAIEQKRLYFNRDNHAAGTQGTWMLKTKNKEVNVCTITDMERPDDGLINFLVKDKNDQYLQMITSGAPVEIKEPEMPDTNEEERQSLIDEIKQMKEDGFIDNIQGVQNAGIEKLRLKASEGRIKKKQLQTA